jgi:hypothetical protein
LIASAFLKKDALHELTKTISLSPKSMTVVARWQKGDLLSGASDLEAYEFCRERGWAFGVDLSFHGKLYMFDRSQIFLGSANLTNSGLSLFTQGNKEFGTMLDAASTDLDKLDRFLQEDVAWIDDHVYALICDEMIKTDPAEVSVGSWPASIRALLANEVRYLWVTDLLFCAPQTLLDSSLSNEEVLHDLSILSLAGQQPTLVSLKAAFRRTRVFSWICSVLRCHDSLNFGGMSANLHNALLDDPRPYRRQVKEFVAVLFAWFELMDDDFLIERYTRTSSVALITRIP